MPRSKILSALLAGLAALVLASCSAADQERVAQTLQRAAKATEGLGMVVTMNGTVSAQGISQPLRSRATIAPDGRRARMSTQVGGLSLEQYLDGHFMLMGLDSVPGAGMSLPRGTRYLKVDIDKVNASMGIDTTMSEMQSLDPRRAAAMLSEAAEVRSVGSDTIGGVKVARYAADVDVEEMAKALSKGTDTSRLAKMFGDAKMQIDIAIDGDDRIRGFGMKGAMGPAKVEMDAVVQSYSRDLKVTIPSRGVYDMTAAITGAFDGPRTP